MQTGLHPRLAIPGPPPSRLLGPQAGVMAVLKDPLGHLTALFRQYGPVVSLAAGGGTRLYSSWPDCPGTVYAYRPEHVQDVALRADVYHKHPLSLLLYAKAGSSPRTEPLRHYGAGLFGVNDDEHRRQRRMLMPSFQKSHVDGYRDTMVAVTEATLRDWRIGSARDLSSDMRLLSLRIATAILFGGDMGREGQAMCELIAESLSLVTRPLTVFAAYDVPGLPYHRFLDVTAKIDQGMRDLIAKRRLAPAGSDVLSTLIGAHDDETRTTLSDDELLGHTNALFAASHETTAGTLTWTLFLLSQHPAVLGALVEELRAVLGGAAPTVADIARLPFLDHVVKESMRVITAVPFNGRIAAKETELGGFQIPAGTEVLISIYHTHHMPELYPEPESFNPIRWERIHPTTFEYHPFSAGPRTCIGASFALLTMKVVLAMLLQRYRFELAPRARIDPTGTIVLAPKRGMPMTVHQNDGAYTRGVGGVTGTVRRAVSLPV